MEVYPVYLVNQILQLLDVRTKMVSTSTGFTRFTFMAYVETISLKVDSDIKNRLDAIASDVGKSKSELVRDILMDYLGESDPNAIESMQARLEAVERKCNRMAKVVFN